MKKLPKTQKILIIATTVLILAIALVFWHEKTSAPGKTTTADTTKNETPQKNAQKTTPEEPKPVTFNKSQYSTTDPSSLWMVVNKKHALPSSYTPELSSIAGGQIRPEALTPLKTLLKDSATQNQQLNIISSYRSYSYQSNLYADYVNNDGAAKADTYSARPGHSEHQTGLAVDLGNGTCNLEICFGDTAVGKWLANNSYKYGFIIRYPSTKTDITGYQYEPWHLRYVGVELSTEMHNQNILTLEEFFGVSGGTSY